MKVIINFLNRFEGEHFWHVKTVRHMKHRENVTVAGP